MFYIMFMVDDDSLWLGGFVNGVWNGLLCSLLMRCGMMFVRNVLLKKYDMRGRKFMCGLFLW